MSNIIEKLTTCILWLTLAILGLGFMLFLSVNTAFIVLILKLIYSI